MVITITGNNSVAMQDHLTGLVGNFINHHGELAVERIDGEESDAQAVLDAVANLPFLADKKLVVVRNLSANKQAADISEQLIGSVHDGVELILYEPNADKRTSFYKTLKKRTDFKEFNQLEGRDLATWLVENANQQGGEISQSDANYLIERVGSNQTLLANELAKLITYQPKVSRQNIDLLTQKTPQSRVFDLLDATFAGQKQKALKLYAEQRSQKVEPQEVLAMIAWQIRLLVVAKLAKNQKPAEVARDIGMSPYPITKAQNLANRLSGRELNELVQKTVELDRLSKTKYIDLDEALKSYIATF